MRFVLDTNVIVSALLLANSVPRKAFDKALSEGSILISVPVLLELAEVLGREHLNKYLLEEERMRFLVALLKEAELVDITTRSRNVETQKTTSSWSSLRVVMQIV